jgi:hypothetical protein
MRVGGAFGLTWVFLFFKFGLSACPASGASTVWSDPCEAFEGVLLLNGNWIANITHQYEGGFVYAYVVRIELTRCVFENIQSGNSGGVIYAVDLETGSVIWLSCASNCQAGELGGFLYMDDCEKFSISEVQITVTIAKEGGGIDLESGYNEVSCVRANFTRATCPEQGAVALYYESSGICEFLDCYFSNCTDTGQRGMLYSYSDSSCSIAVNRSIFVNNTCYAVKIAGGTAHILDCFLEGTWGFARAGGTMTVERCYVSNSSLTTSGTITNLGGHVYLTVTSPNVGIGTYIIQCPFYVIETGPTKSLEATKSFEVTKPFNPSFQEALWITGKIGGSRENVKSAAGPSTEIGKLESLTLGEAASMRARETEMENPYWKHVEIIRWGLFLVLIIL